MANIKKEDRMKRLADALYATIIEKDVPISIAMGAVAYLAVMMVKLTGKAGKDLARKFSEIILSEAEGDEDGTDLHE